MLIGTIHIQGNVNNTVKSKFNLEILYDKDKSKECKFYIL
jgi:hypothetical protein